MLTDEKVEEIKKHCDTFFGPGGMFYKDSVYVLIDYTNDLLADRAELQAEVARLSEKLKRETERSEKYYIWYLKEKEKREAETARANAAEQANEDWDDQDCNVCVLKNRECCDEVCESKSSLLSEIERLRAVIEDMRVSSEAKTVFNDLLYEWKARAEKAEAELDSLKTDKTILAGINAVCEKEFTPIGEIDWKARAEKAKRERNALLRAIKETRESGNHVCEMCESYEYFCADKCLGWESWEFDYKRFGEGGDEK